MNTQKILEAKIKELEAERDWYKNVAASNESANNDACQCLYAAQNKIKELEEWMEDLKLIFTPKQPASDKWISVKDKSVVPVIGEKYLVYDAEPQNKEDYIYVDEFYRFEGDTLIFGWGGDTITHYQYLSKPPIK